MRTNVERSEFILCVSIHEHAYVRAVHGGMCAEHGMGLLHTAGCCTSNHVSACMYIAAVGSRKSRM